MTKKLGVIALFAAFIIVGFTTAPAMAQLRFSGGDWGTGPGRGGSNLRIGRSNVVGTIGGGIRWSGGNRGLSTGNGSGDWISTAIVTGGQVTIGLAGIGAEKDAVAAQQTVALAEIGGNVQIAEIEADKERDLADRAAAIAGAPKSTSPGGGASTMIPRTIVNDERGAPLIVTVPGASPVVIPPKSSAVVKLPLSGTYTIEFINNSGGTATMAAATCSEEKKGLVCEK